MINFQICGNLGKDALLNEHIQNSGSESSLIEFPIYSNQYKGDSGIYNMQFWCRSEKRIELILETFKSGTQVTCFGRIEQEKYQDKNTGDNRTKTKFIVTDFEIPVKKEEGNTPKSGYKKEALPF
jgi:single-stranded DNA-binding protein